MKQNLLKTCLVMLLAVLGVSMSWADVVKSTFTSNKWAVGAGEPEWVKTGADATSFESANSARGVQTTLTNIKTSGLSLTNSTIKELGTIKSVTLVISANGTGGSISSVKVGTTDFMNGESKSYDVPNNNNQTVTFSDATGAKGDIEISFGSTATSKSLYVKSIEVTYETSGGGTNPPTPTTYTVTVANNIANGTVTASATSATAGTTINLTATPYEGYEFGAWDVKDASSNSITVTDNAFKMPASNVTVSAKFTAKEVIDPNAKTATWVASEQNYTNGTQYTSAKVDSNISLAFGDGTNDGKYYTTGTGIRLYANGKVTVTAKTGCTMSKIVLTYSEKSYTGTFSASTGDYTLSETTGTWKGTASSVVLTNTANTGHARIQSIAVTYVGEGTAEPEPTYYTVTIAKDIAHGTVTATPTTAEAGTTVTLTTTPAEGYIFGAWDVKGADNTSITVSNNKFTMPAQNVTVSATFNEKAPEVVTDKTIAEFIAAEGGKCYLTGTVSNIVNTTYGNFDLTDASGTIYVYGCLNQNGEAQKFAELGIAAGDKIKVLAETYELYNGTKEAKNVIFVEIVEKSAIPQYNVTIAEGIANGTVTASVKKAAEGDVVTLTAKAADGYVFGEWNVKGADNSTISVTNNKFTMPAQNVTVSATFAKEAPSVTFDLTEDETVAATEELLAWTSNYVSMYAEKGKSTTAVNNYYPGTNNRTSTRFYSSSNLTINPAPGVTLSSIIYEATTTDYANKLNNSTWTNASAKVNETTVTITPTDGTKPVIAAVGGTTGATSVKVFYTGVPTDAPYVPSTTEPEPEPTVYTITVNEYIQNGTVSVSATSAKEGDVITLTATPAEGYELEEYIVTRTDNNAELTVTNNKFTMPAANVSVTATFKAVTGGEPTPDAGEGVTYTFGTFTQANDVTLEADGYTITLHKNTGSTAPQWNANSSEARVYAKGSVDIVSSKNIVKVVYDYVENAGGKNNVVPTIDGVAGATTDGTWNAETKTWTGSDTKVTLTTSGSAGNLGFKSITVYFGEKTNGTLNFVATNEDGYWATFSSTEDVIFDANDVIVYTVAVDNNELVLLDANNNSLSCVTDKTKDSGWVAGYYVQAGAAVLINAVDASVNYYYIDTDAYTPNQLTNVEAYGEYNMLRPASAAMTDGYNFYKFAYDNFDAKAGLGFFWGAADGAAFTCKAGTAYLAVPKAGASNLRGFSLEGNGCITGIDTITADKANTEIYNLQGQRVSRLQQGVNIVNGKKVIR